MKEVSIWETSHLQFVTKNLSSSSKAATLVYGDRQLVTHSERDMWRHSAGARAEEGAQHLGSLLLHHFLTECIGFVWQGFGSRGLQKSVCVGGSV